MIVNVAGRSDEHYEIVGGKKCQTIYLSESCAGVLSHWGFC
jgi:hypothetical protein